MARVSGCILFTVKLSKSHNGSRPDENGAERTTFPRARRFPELRMKRSDDKDARTIFTWCISVPGFSHTSCTVALEIIRCLL